MIDVGDKVVCVSTRAPCCGQGYREGASRPVRGRYYVVGAVGFGQCVHCGATMPCLAPAGFEREVWAWAQPGFRKVDGATDDTFRLADVSVKEDA